MTDESVNKADKSVKRDAKGHFQPGTKPGPGNPHAADIGKLRALLFAKIKDKEWNAIRQALVEKAMEGSKDHIALLFSYTLGKPAQSIDVNMTQATITPEEAQARIKKFFGIEQ